ncbi:glycosyltransferase family 4 protein [Geodermatophilus sabuli]|uniref:Glycosyltransferase involved in cell wall bisynthesis n=1 Tax=Geodermatophilus sabuli TaxID=1564158 RepID=A0A285EGT4_9ACTN|nr:glycosyltransferase family 4 protein [Geodermatophilus sabuli]MBB3083215.1 glycosyltransferase involved in cell wall biosynthesis [Geodermatophilus sabuli]SNX98210.1 Glycosyltransferase involved in cell wall bisynthesis [Geodermatophilus sabuli]
MSDEPRILHVLHVGPDVETTGGMATVIGLLARAPGTGVRAATAATWAPSARDHGLGAAIRLVAGLAGRGGRRPDWVHAHLSEGGSFLREGAVLLIARALGIRTAATLHGARFLQFSSRHATLVRLVLRSCSVVFTLGPHAAARVSALCPDTLVRPVLNPVDMAELATAPLPTHVADIVFGGVVGSRKGVDRLVAAWPSVRRRHPEATCLLCGPPGDLPLTDLPDGMRYAGSLARSELLGVLGSARVACLPSRDEALPMFVLESLALGVPVVTTPVGEIDQLGEEQGVALVDGDPARLAATLGDLLADPARRAEWGRRGLAWAQENCSVEAVGRALTTSYRAA